MFGDLLNEFYQTIAMSPEQARVMRLSSTHATTSSVYAFRWRIDSLLGALGESTATMAETQIQQQRREQIKIAVSGLTDTVHLLKDLKSTEEQLAFLRTLKREMEDHASSSKYTSEQLKVMRNTYTYITSRIHAKGDLSELTPEWFIPWYELLVDKWKSLGEGSFGSVYQAKWLDSNVVVKEVILAGSSETNDTFSFDSMFSAPETPSDPEANASMRTEALKMFRREVGIWFRFSHPHVIRLFGACHVGRLFFVCEYAPSGTLVGFLRNHPDELWSKLYEAALGVQYLYARNVVHGDLKGNNIMIGSDMKAKVTDFGLSSISTDNSKPSISGAWHWVAPECIDHDT